MTKVGVAMATIKFTWSIIMAELKFWFAYLCVLVQKISRYVKVVAETFVQHNLFFVKTEWAMGHLKIKKKK